MLVFYPSIDERLRGALHDRIVVLLEAAEEYKAAVLGAADEGGVSRSKHPAPITPREQVVSYNWDEVARVLREIKGMSESDHGDKLHKADLLMQLAEVYEVLRAAKMAKLEGVRHALTSEAAELYRQGRAPV